MKHKLQKSILAAAGLGVLFNVVSSKQHEKELRNPAAAVAQGASFASAVAPISAPVNTPATAPRPASALVFIPQFNAAEYRDIAIKPVSELHGDAAILNAAETALYKIHAQNKDLDALRPHTYDELFLRNVTTAAESFADDTFALKAAALGTAAYDLAYLHGEFNDKTLLAAKFDIMPKVSLIMRAEQLKYGKETENTEEMLYRVSYMGLKQLHEIIALLKQATAESFTGEKQGYGAKVADLIANVNSYHGWTAGLKKMGAAPTVSSSFYSNLDLDLSAHRSRKQLTTANDREL